MIIVASLSKANGFEWTWTNNGSVPCNRFQCPMVSQIMWATKNWGGGGGGGDIHIKLIKALASCLPTYLTGQYCEGREDFGHLNPRTCFEPDSRPKSFALAGKTFPPELHTSVNRKSVCRLHLRDWALGNWGLVWHFCYKLSHTKRMNKWKKNGIPQLTTWRYCSQQNLGLRTEHSNTKYITKFILKMQTCPLLLQHSPPVIDKLFSETSTRTRVFFRFC